MLDTRIQEVFGEILRNILSAIVGYKGSNGARVTLLERSSELFKETKHLVF